MQDKVQLRLLVVRLGAMGDVIHALPAITALRQAHPEWKIDWAIDPKWLALLSAETQQALGGADRNEARPVVDQVHLVPSKDWGKRPFSKDTREAIRELRTDLRAGQYDAVLDLQGAIRSSLVARLSGCKRIIGEAAPRETLARLFFTEKVATTTPHVIEQDFELASAVAGDQLQQAPPLLPVDWEAENWCDEFAEIRTWKPIVLIHAGAGWGAKRWPADRFGAVAEDFAMRGAVVLVNVGPGEDEIAAKVLQSANGHVSIVHSTLPQLIALTRRVSLVIGGDTGPVHLACALGKPVVGIYGPTDPARNGPYGTAFRVLRNPESRTDHSRREEPEAGLLTISPDAVMAACASVMLEDRQTRRTDQPAGSEERWEPAEPEIRRR